MEARSAVLEAARRYREAREHMREVRRAGIHDRIEWQAYQDVNRCESELMAAIELLEAEVLSA